MKQNILFIIALSLACILLPSLSNAETYKFIDKEGTTHMVDDVNKVPEEYRATMEVSDGRRHRERPDAAGPTQEDSEKLLKNLTTEPAVRVEEQAKPATIMQQITAAFDKPGLGTGLKIIVAVVFMVIAWLIISKIAENLGMRKIGSLVCIILVGAATVFLFRMSAQKAADKVASVMDKVKGITGKLQDKADAAKAVRTEFQNEQPARMGMVEQPKTSDAELLKEDGVAAMNPSAKEEKLTLTLPSFENK